MKNYKGPKALIDRTYKRLFYDFNDIEELIADVETERAEKIKMYGLDKYRQYMSINAKDSLYKRFTKAS